MASALPILDEAHLARQTSGDAALKREVLALFVAQLDELAPRIAEADGARRDALLHRLKGSARAVGAMALGQMAEELEGAHAQGEGTGAHGQEPDTLQAMLAATLHALKLRLA